MHYYKFNIADYRKDTGHLSPFEHYIYRALIDGYYLDENPIVTQSVIRRLRLVSENIADLNNVLTDFFIEREDGWHHVRIDTEIEEYHKKSSINRSNGSKGGRPKKTQPVNSGLRKKPNRNPNHKPITNNQEPIKEKKQKKKAIAFSRPSENDINNFALENKLNLGGMFDFYESNGWKVGRNSMKNWQATARNWNRRNNNGTRGNKTISGQFESKATRLHRRNKELYERGERKDALARAVDGLVIEQITN